MVWDAKCRVLGDLRCQIWVMGDGFGGGLGCQVNGFGRRHWELKPRPPDPKPCGQPLGYMGFVWVVWGAKYGVLGGLGCQIRGFGWLLAPNTRFWMVWGAKYGVSGGLGCRIQGFGWLGVPNTGFWVVWDAKYRVSGGLGCQIIREKYNTS